MAIMIRKAFEPEEEHTRRREFELFRDHLELIFAHTPRILSCGEYFHCRLSFAYVNTFYLGGGPIPLGVLLRGWENGILREDCPRCGRHSLWILRFGGGLVAGHKAGVCTECRAWISLDCGVKGYIPIWRAVVPMILSFPLFETFEVVVEKDVPEFSWSRGLIYRKKRVKEAFKMQVCEPVRLEELLQDLKEGRERTCSEVVFRPETPDLRKLFFRKRGWA